MEIQLCLNVGPLPFSGEGDSDIFDNFWIFSRCLDLNQTYHKAFLSVSNLLKEKDTPFSKGRI